MFAFGAQLTSFRVLAWKMELECYFLCWYLEEWQAQAICLKSFLGLAEKAATHWCWVESSRRIALLKRISTCLCVHDSISIIAFQLKSIAAWIWLWHEIYLFCNGTWALCRAYTHSTHRDTCRYGLKHAIELCVPLKSVWHSKHI